MKLYTLYDRVAKTTTTPIAFRNEQIAERTFKFLASQEARTEFNTNQKDKEILYIGEMDGETGELSTIIDKETGKTLRPIFKWTLTELVDPKLQLDKAARRKELKKELKEEILAELKDKGE